MSVYKETIKFLTVIISLFWILETLRPILLQIFEVLWFFCILFSCYFFLLNLWNFVIFLYLITLKFWGSILLYYLSHLNYWNLVILPYSVIKTKNFTVIIGNFFSFMHLCLLNHYFLKVYSYWSYFLNFGMIITTLI